jgi:cbb3-type cytochrome oxidase subunit 3
MKAPVWHLISRIDLTGGSSSYHRFQLVNQCILHFRDWWLIGTKNYPNWGWDMWDLSNQYVGIADVSGLIPLLAFVAIIVFAFQYVAKSRRLASNKREELFVWALGAALFANVVAFFGIGYFDQTIVAWYALLAMIPVVAYSLRKQRRAEKEKSQQEEIPQIGLEADPELDQVPRFA